MQNFIRPGGNTRVEVGSGRRSDEVGQIQRYLAHLREAVARAYRLSQMVEDMPSSVVTCDLQDFRVTYLNKQAKALFDDLHRALDAIGLRHARRLTDDATAPVLRLRVAGPLRRRLRQVSPSLMNRPSPPDTTSQGSRGATRRPPSSPRWGRDRWGPISST